MPLRTYPRLVAIETCTKQGNLVHQGTKEKVCNSKFGETSVTRCIMDLQCIWTTVKRLSADVSSLALRQSKSLYGSDLYLIHNWIRSDERANAKNVSTQISLRWPRHLINSVD